MSGVSPEERVWQKLVDEVGEALIEEAATVSVAQAEKDLAAAGFDVAAERARAEAFLASLEGGAASVDPVEAVAQEPAPASDLRRRAAVAYTEGHAKECLDLLDQARAKDPAGDATPAVTQLRDKAAIALEHKPDPR